MGPNGKAVLLGFFNDPMTRWLNELIEEE